jgi:hypothetical protein
MLSEELLSGMSKMVIDIVSKAVRHCGVRHNFDAEVMLRELNMEEMSVCVGVGISKPVKVKEVKVKEVKVKEVKSKYPMPFCGEAKEGCCQALRQNHGLYTQCETIVNAEETYCKKCGPSRQFGTIQERLEVGLMEFRDSNGKGPIPFTKVMKKLKISREEVEEEASKLNIMINLIHFEEEKVEKREKGRPKKAKKIVELENDSTDLFAALVAKANEDSDSDSDSEELELKLAHEKVAIAESIVESVLDKVSVIAENNEKKAEKEALKKAEKEAEKQALLQKKEAEKALKEAEKEALFQKKEAEKALKEAKKEAEKAALLQKKEAEKALKEAEKSSAKAVKSKKESSDSESDKKKAKPVAAKKAKVEEEEEEDVVKRFEFEGVKYLKSKKTGIIYNMEQDVIGKWNEKTGKIDFQEADSEEEEDEYEA